MALRDVLKINTRKKHYRYIIIIILLLLLFQSRDDTVFSPTSPAGGDFVVDLVPQSTNKSVGISVFGGADTGTSTVFINTLTPDGLAADDGRLRAGKHSR